MAAVGDVLGGKYRLDFLLGEGGMGAVFAAENLNTGRRVAVKVLRGEWMAHPSVQQRFIREARATTAIAHPNIVEVLDLDTDAAQRVIYIVQEFLEGETLERRLSTSSGATLHPAEAVTILVPVLRALIAAHARGIVHRDIKPANLFLTRSRDGAVEPKVIDFGIAKDVTAAGGTHQTREGSAVGTPAYMSPEQVAGRTDLDARTDIWALGVVLYEMLSGRLPYEAEHSNVLMAKVLYEVPIPLATRCPDLPAEIVEVVERALQRDREARFESAEAMLAALEGLDLIASGSDRPTTDTRTVPPGSTRASNTIEAVARTAPAGDAAQGSRWTVAVAAAVVTVLVGVAAFVSRPAPPSRVLQTRGDSSPGARAETQVVPFTAIVSETPAASPAAPTPVRADAGSATAEVATPSATSAAATATAQPAARSAQPRRRPARSSGVATPAPHVPVLNADEM